MALGNAHDKSMHLCKITNRAHGKIHMVSTWHCCVYLKVIILMLENTGLPFLQVDAKFLALDVLSIDPHWFGPLYHQSSHSQDFKCRQPSPGSFCCNGTKFQTQKITTVINKSNLHPRTVQISSKSSGKNLPLTSTSASIVGELVGSPSVVGKERQPSVKRSRVFPYLTMRGLTSMYSSPWPLSPVGL